MCDPNNASIGELNEKSLFIKTNVCIPPVIPIQPVLDLPYKQKV